MLELRINKTVMYTRSQGRTMGELNVKRVLGVKWQEGYELEMKKDVHGIVERIELLIDMKSKAPVLYWQSLLSLDILVRVGCRG